MKRVWLRTAIVALGLAAAAGGCGPEATSLNACENARVKTRLCEVDSDSFPVDVCGRELTEEERCVAQCWYKAPCDDLVDWIESEPGERDIGIDVTECLEDCQGDTSGDEFACGDGERIPRTFVCDGTPDCRNEADERGCESSSDAG